MSVVGAQVRAISRNKSDRQRLKVGGVVYNALIQNAMYRIVGTL